MFVALLLAVAMVPAAGVQSALADEPVARPATESGDVALEAPADDGAAAAEGGEAAVAATVREDGSLVAEGLVYSVFDGGAVLVGFEDGGSLGDNVVVPERLSDGTNEYAVTGVDVAEGQAAPGVKALTLPQTVEDVDTKSLAAAMPGLASINVGGTAGAYSSANGLLFRQADEAASSDGSAVRVANRELVWTPPATVIARIPGTCKQVAAGAFTDAAALETIMAFSTVESIARPEKDADGNLTKEGAFTEEQVSRVNIVIPISATVQPEGTDRISADVFLSEQVGLDVKQTPWCDYGFDIERFTVGIPHGSTSVTVAVPEDGVVGTPVITIGNYIDYPQWNPKPGEVDWPEDGLVFEYRADMTVSVRWDGDKAAIPAHLELPAYVVENGVKTAVTEVAPSAFENAAQLESVVIPEGVTTIGESAFAGCSGLKSVSLPSTLKTIDYAAFKGAGLESVEIPSGVRWIGGEAFADCAEPVVGSAEQCMLAISQGKQATFDVARSSEVTKSEQGMDAYAAGTTVRVEYKEIPSNYSVHYNFGRAPSYAPGREDMFPYAIPDAGFDVPLNLADDNHYTYYYNSADVHIGTVSNATSVTAVHCFAPFRSDGSLIDCTAFPLALRLYDSDGAELAQKTDWGPCEIPSTPILFSVSTMTVTLDYGPGQAAQQLGFFQPSVTDTYNNLPDITNLRDGYVGIWTYTDAVGNEKIVTESTTLAETTTSAHALKAKYVLKEMTTTVTGGTGYDGASLSLASGDGDYTSSNVALNGSGSGASELKIKSEAVQDHSYRTWLQADANGNLKLLKDDADDAAVGATLSPKVGSGYHVQKWVLDKGTAGERSIDASSGRVPVEFTDSHTLECVTVPDTSTLTLHAGVAAWGSQRSMTLNYTTGDSVALDGAEVMTGFTGFAGFWLKGWVWTTAEQDKVVHFAGTDRNTPTLSIPAGSYGNAELHAVWVPQKYTANYDVAKAGAAFSGSPESTVFISQDACDYIDANKIDPDDESSAMVADWNTGYADQDGHRYSDKPWIDTSGIDSDTAHARDLAGKTDDPAVSDLAPAGYNFEGWTTSTSHTFDTQPLPTDTAYGLDKNGKLPMSKAFEGVWNKTYIANDASMAANKTTLYGLWTHRSMPEDGVKLESNGAPDKNNEGNVVCASDGKSVESGTDKIYYWQGRGFVSAAERGSMSTSSPVRNKAGDISADMGLKAPVRYGFQFLGWGVPAAKSDTGENVLFISYDENAARESGNAAKGFKLEQAGVDLMYEDPTAENKSFRTDLENKDWQAIWKIRTVDVTLRIPSHAVSDVDVSGWSTEAGHNDKTGIDKTDCAKYEYADYKWREGTAEETDQGASAGWLIAKRTWNYFDLIEYPSFKTQADRYTYDGWYDLMKPSMTDSTDKALADLGDKVKLVATFEDMRQPNPRVYATGDGAATGDASKGGLSIGETYFTVGDSAAQSAGQKTLWLWTSPIRINVASPVGVYLCTTNSYGQAVDPYVVGNDRREQLEAQAEFQVATGSHDLQLVGVTAEDVTSFDYKKDGDGNVVRTDDDASAPVVDADSVQSSATDPGMAAKILDVTFPEDTDNKRYDGDSSRMFWVSPVPTATADQAGVVYGSANSTAAAEAGKVKGASSLVGDEANLKPEVEKRRYFGFTTADHGIEDELDSSTSSGKTYELGDFVLRRHDNYANGQTDGLALVKYDDTSKTSTYRFYYGLDMRRAQFDLAGLQGLIENSRGTLDYDSTFDQPLLRVKFTFAAARNDGISYFSVRDDGDGAAAGGDGLSEDTVITVSAPSA